MDGPVKASPPTDTRKQTKGPLILRSKLGSSLDLTHVPNHVLAHLS